MSEYRQPTVSEAVDLMMITITKQQRKENLAHWRKLYGDEYADEIAERVKEKWKARKK